LSKELEEILTKIQELRKKLQDVAMDKDLTDTEVIAVSRMLDVVLNEYERLVREKGKK